MEALGDATNRYSNEFRSHTNPEEQNTKSPSPTLPLESHRKRLLLRSFGFVERDNFARSSLDSLMEQEVWNSPMHEKIDDYDGVNPEAENVNASSANDIDASLKKYEYTDENLVEIPYPSSELPSPKQNQRNQFDQIDLTRPFPSDFRDERNDRRASVLHRAIARLLEAHVVANGHAFASQLRISTDQRPRGGCSSLNLMSTSEVYEIVTNGRDTSNSATFRSFSQRLELELKHVIAAKVALRKANHSLEQLCSVLRLDRNDASKFPPLGKEESISDSRTIESGIEAINSRIENLVKISFSDENLMSPSVSDVPRLPRSTARTERPMWVPNFASDKCSICRNQFWLFVRRHHCRLCGQLICADCSPHRVPVDWSTELERACTRCVNRVLLEHQSVETR